MSTYCGPDPLSGWFAAVLKEELMFASRCTGSASVKAEVSAELRSYLMELHRKGQWVVHFD